MTQQIHATMFIWAVASWRTCSLYMHVCMLP